MTQDPLILKPRDQKTLILHLGYHQTGGDLIGQWLAEHEALLAPHLDVWTGDHIAPLRRACAEMVRGCSGAAETLAETCAALTEEINKSDAPVAVVSDEDLLGPPLGHVDHGHVETEIYPGLCRVIDGLAAGLADFELVVAVMERDPEPWLRRLHDAACARGFFEGRFEDYLARFEPMLDWDALRHEIRFGLQGRGRLETFSYAREFAQPNVAAMEVFGLFGIPEAVLAQGRARLRPPEPPAQRRHAVQRYPKHQALVLGGVNSMTPQGWVTLLRQQYRDLIEIVNLSAGSVTSVMALYQLLAEGDRWPGVPVLWEQGINEFTHQASGQDLDSLLYHAEWLLQLCIRQNRPLVPVLMRTRGQAAMEGEGSYARQIKALFDRYGVPVIDCDRLLAVAARGAVELDAWYQGNVLYADGTLFSPLLADTALLALDRARVPVAPHDRAAHFDALDLRLCPPEYPTESFDSTPGGLPCAFAPFDARPRVSVSGPVLAAILATGTSGPVINLQAGDSLLGRYATQIQQGPNSPPTQLRQLIPGPGRGGLEIPGGVVQIDLDDSPDPPIVQPMYQQEEPPSEPLPTGLVALLCETPRAP